MHGKSQWSSWPQPRYVFNSSDGKRQYATRSWVSDGDVVWMVGRNKDGKLCMTRWVVACAAGNHARVVSQASPNEMGQWVSVDDLYERRDVA